MSKVSERDVLRKVCTRIAEIGGLKGISSRNLNNIETARKGVKELLDEYADKKHLAELERLKENFNIVKTISDKITEENCKLKTENHDLKALLKDKNAVISEMTVENSELRDKKIKLHDKNLELNEDIAYYKKTLEVMNKEIKVLTEENKFLSKPWYARLFSL
ncbi:MAG: hypothetical protein SOR11_04520 [Fusobacterium sp.]|uniref:hypothetical protein n=1 Tax=Fusobacterium sp. TaxID=68766 RepID=UPI002A751021|nr:hypothetical protein [Fusobacterium sp.]MDY3059248.1 hypothetical protein [Fusobacterium sp.]